MNKVAMVTLTLLSKFFSWLVASFEWTKWKRAVLAAVCRGRVAVSIQEYPRVSKSIQDMHVDHVTFPTCSCSRDEFHLVPVGGTTKRGKPCNDSSTTSPLLVVGQCLVGSTDWDGKEQHVLLKWAAREGVEN